MSNVTRISRYGFVNCYLVREEDGITVIDTMLPGSAKKIVAAAQELAAPIRRIVLTHAHGDHIGSLDALAAAVPDAEVIIGEREARLLEKDFTMEPDETQWGKRRGSYPGARTKPSRTVVEGERIGSLEAISSPGHTPGHMAFLDTRDRTLFPGDVYSTLGGTAVSAHMNPRFPLIYMGTWNRPVDATSARRLREREPARLAPGHGKILDSPLAAMDAALARVS
jgi:glyoxylase-like metal-dependent hydrolase (beta-lactamase superfamily II)